MAEQIPEISEPIQPVQSVPLEPKKKYNLPVIVILLVVILLIAGGVYSGIKIGKKQAGGGLVQKITPTSIPQPTPISTSVPAPDETANWKTYTNIKYGFEFKYPDNKVVSIRENAYIGVCNLKNGVAGIIVYPQGTEIPPTNDLFEMRLDVDIEENPQNISVSNWISKNCEGTWLINAKKEIVTIGGISSSIFTAAGEGEFMGLPENQPMIVVQKSNLLFFLHPYVTGAKVDTQLFDQILSTFRFTN